MGETADGERASQLIAGDRRDAVGSDAVFGEQVEDVCRQPPAQLKEAGGFGGSGISDHHAIWAGVERRPFQRQQLVPPNDNLISRPDRNSFAHKQSGAGRSPDAASYSKSTPQISRNGSGKLMPARARPARQGGLRT